jgi:PPOX class probable F420-dependent enzyme
MLNAHEDHTMPGIIEATPESHRDLLTTPLTATLTTVDPEGRPQSTAIWYLIDDGQLVGSTTSDRRKYKNLTNNPSCSLFIIDPDSSYRTIEVRAEAELRPDPDKATVRKFAQAYGMDEAMLVNQQEDRYTIILRPRRIVVNPPSGG